MRHILWAPFLLLLAAAAAAAEDEVQPIPLSLHPAAAASPALKYALLPELRDTIPGNAVEHYRRAVQTMKQDLPPEKEWRAVVDKWMALPLMDLPREDVGKLLKQCAAMFQEVEAGARSEQCEWGLTEQIRKEGISVRLQDVQEIRHSATLLALRIRYELAEGHPDKAAHTLQIGFALSRHLADAPSDICALVGIVVGILIADRLQEFIQQPDTPNLYWPLTDLPRPFIDMKKVMQGERVAAYGNFPGMAEMAADLNAKPFAPKRIETFVKLIEVFNPEQNPIRQMQNRILLAQRLLAQHEAAKATLIAEGRPEELVDAMPHFQVGLMAAFLQYDRMFDDYMKWQGLPFWEAREGMAAVYFQQLELRLDDKNGPAIPLVQLIMPSFLRLFDSRTRLDRRIAALRCIEAVRLYAAAHDGKLPPSLEEIKDAPAPLDPVTGKAFNYRVVGDRAFLTCVPFPGQPADNANTSSFELMFQR